MNNNIEEILSKKGVQYTPSESCITIQCPFCRKTDALGNAVGCFNIDRRTNRGECGECPKNVESDEWVGALEVVGSESVETTKKDFSKKQTFQENKVSVFEVIDVGKILATEFGPEVWTVEGLIPEQSITAIGGAPGSFKTWLTLDIARCISTGEDFLGKFKVTKGPVLFIDKENNFRHLQKRFLQIGIGIEHQIYYLNQDSQDFFIEKDDKFDALKEKVRNMEIKLVVFDSLVRIHGGDENDARSISIVMNKFKQLTNLGASVIFIHHHRKEPAGKKSSGNSLRGSSDILAGVDSLLIVEKLEKEQTLIINQAKLRQEQAQDPFGVTIQIGETDKTVKFIYSGSYDSNKAIVDEITPTIVATIKEKGEVGRQELIDLLSEEYKANHVSMALREIIKMENSPIGFRKGPSNKFIYFLK